MGDNNKKNDFEDKTSVVSSDTLKMRLDEAVKSPPAIVLLMGPAHMVGKQWPLMKSDTSIGRVVEANVFVEDRSLSKRHASLLKTDESVAVIDHGSTNGTELNGVVIATNTPVILKNNDHLKCGNVIFKFLEQGNIETVTSKETYDRVQMDPLTRIYNKGALLSTGKEVFKRAKLTSTPLSCIVFDLDNFKVINDTHGHQAGDFVLREMASVIHNKLIRQGDFFARFGGEEFCLIMVGTQQERALEIAERIRSTIEKHDFLYEGLNLRVTISVGVASLTDEQNSWDELFEKADQAAYESKRGGKNKVSSA